MKNKKGFTLVEIVIVIAVIAILAGVILPSFTGVIENAKVSAAMSNALNNMRKYYTNLSHYDVTTIGTHRDLKGYVFIIESGDGKADYKFTVTEDGTLSDSEKIDHNISVDPITIDDTTITDIGYTQETEEKYLDGITHGCYIYYTSACKRPIEES